MLATPDAAPDAAPDARPPSTSEATSYAIDPAHDSSQPTDAVASPLSPRWTARFSGPVSYPLVTAGRAIVAAAESSPNVRALDLETGALLWGPIVFGHPVTITYDRGRVFALDANGILGALDVATGTRVWSVELSPNNFTDAPPVAAGGVVYVNGEGVGGTTFAVDESTGALLWTAEFNGSDGTVAVAGGVVYEGGPCDEVSAFDAITGHLNWFHDVHCSGGGGEAPALHEGFVYARDLFGLNRILDLTGNDVGTFPGSVMPAFEGDLGFFTVSNRLDAVSLSTGMTKWEFVGDGMLCTTAVVAGGGGQVFVGSRSGYVYEVDETSGLSNSASDTGSPVTCGSEYESMAVASGHLLVPAGNTLVVY